MNADGQEEALKELDLDYLSKDKRFNMELPGHSCDDFDMQCTWYTKYTNKFLCNTCDRFDDCLTQRNNGAMIDIPEMKSPFRRFLTPSRKCPKYTAILQTPSETLYVFTSDGQCHMVNQICVHPVCQLNGNGCRDCQHAIYKRMHDPGCGICFNYTLPSTEEWANAQMMYRSWVKAGAAYYWKNPNPRARVNASNGTIKAGGKAQKEYCVYRYIDKADGITKYVGITNNMKRRVKEHTIDKLANTNWEIWFMSGLSKTDAMLLESHFISKYKTYKYFNVSKANDGISRFLKSTPKWELYSA